MKEPDKYRISTAIFALLFAAMVLKDLTGSRQDASPDLPPAAESSQTPTGPGTTEEGGAEVEVAVDSRTSIEPAAGNAGSPVPALDLAMRSLLCGRGSANWPKALPFLRSRRRELVPILADWLRRREELIREGVDLRNVPRAYAELAGVQALPLLEELLSDPGRRWSHATNEALTRIDDPGAVALIRKYQESLPENHSDVNLRGLWSGTLLARKLLKDWARTPPANAPRLGGMSRAYWFHKGGMEDREDAWELMDDLERLNALGGAHARSWGGPWPERYTSITSAALRDREPRRRCRAIFNVIADADAASAELLSEVERALDHEIQAAEGRPRSEGPTQRSLLSLKKSLDAWRERTEAERRRRELLTPR